MKKKCITIFAFIVLILTISNTSQVVPTIVEYFCDSDSRVPGTIFLVSIGTGFVGWLRKKMSFS